ncbi:MAG: tetratricopeptide repeat protein, partial [Nitrosopumilus sp.]|nr:tetratricopeptide repeat protein [Nitrosopumilus sp.]
MNSLIFILFGILLISFGLVNFAETDAASHYDEELEKYPNSVDALNDKGYQLFEQGKYDEAITYFDRVLEIEPDNEYALLTKGTALERLGEYNEAIFYYDQALDSNPNSVLALNNKGAALYNLGKYDEAIKYYDQALKIDPNYETALKNKELALSSKPSIYENKIFGYSFVHPASWQINDVPEEGILFIKPMKNDKTTPLPFFASITAEYVSSELTLDEYVPVVNKFMEEVFPNYKVKESNPAILSGNIAKKQIFTSNDPNVEIEGIIIIIIDDDKALTVMAGSPSEFFSQYEPDIIKLIESVKFIEKLPEQEVPFVYYENQEYEFKIQYPQNWIRIPEPALNVIVSFIPPDQVDSKFPNTVNIQVLDSPATISSLEEYVDESTQAMKSQLSSFEILESGYTSFAGQQAFKMTSIIDYSNIDIDLEQGKISQKEPLSTLIDSIKQESLAQGYQIVMMKDDKIYIITYTATPETFSDYFSTATKIIDSFEFESKVSKSVEIPEWIKNNAKWWVEGTIDDKAFVGGIQFLIKEGIIQIPETTKSSELTS